MPVEVTILGAREARTYLRRLQGGVRAAGGVLVRVGSDLPYAWGITFGRHRGGRLARRAGGTMALPGALASVQPAIGPAVAAALPDGRDEVLRVLLGFGEKVKRLAKEREAVRSGSLRRSYHTVVGR